MKSQDQHGYAKVEQSFLRAAWDSNYWDEAVQHASDAFGAFGAALLPVVGTLPRYPVAPTSYELFDDFLKSGWYLQDERRRSITVLLRDGAAIESDYISEGEMSKLPFYNDFLAKYGVRWFGGMLLSAGDDRWCVAFQRSLESGPFSLKDKRKMAAWGKRLSALASLSNEIGASKLNLAADLLEAMGRPCALVGRNGELVRMNRAAERLLTVDLSYRRGRIEFSNRGDNEVFASAVRALLDPNASRYSIGPLTIEREGLRPLLFSLINIDRLDSTPFSPAKILVLINDLEARPLVLADDLKTVFGMTQTEAAVASMLSEGAELADVAARLQITKHTVRTHLKSVFQKTETKKQSALLALIARMKK